VFLLSSFAHNLERMVLNIRTLSVFVVALVGHLPGFASLVQAQGLPQVIREAIADKVGIPADAPDFDARIEALSRQKPTEEMMRRGLAKSLGVDPSEINLDGQLRPPDDPIGRSEVPQQVVSRSAFEGGAPLDEPTKRELAAMTTLSEAELADAINRINASGRKLAERFSKPGPISVCAEGKTVRDEAPPGSDGTDILVISEKPPLDFDQLYGRRTNVIQFLSGDKADSDSRLIALAQPECLPYRVRVYERQRYVHYGEHALRNFDAKPGGAGKQAIKRSNFKER
jgi:hypothetical protein